MADTNLSKRQEAVYNYLKKVISRSFPPTVREICEATGISSTSTVHAALSVLEEKGYIIRDAKSSRGIRLAGTENTSLVPVIGRVSAGVPILAVEQIEGYIPFPVTYERSEELFALSVKGLSMRDAGTHDGIRHEGLDAVVVADALHDVSRIPCLEKGDGQPREFGKEAVDERDADERSALQREPSAQQVVAQLPQGEHQLGKQHQRNDIQALVADATIHHVLRKERQRHAEEAAYGHGSQYAEQRLGMWQHMLEQVGPGELHFALAVQPSECFGGCQYQGMSSPSLLLLPMLQELLAAVVQESVCRVYHHGLFLPAPQVLSDAGEHHKVVSPPVHDARFLYLLQFLPRQAEGTSLHPELFRRRLQFEERGTLVAASGHLLHGSGREVLAVVAEDDAETSGSAIGMIMLFVKMVFGHENFSLLIELLFGCKSSRITRASSFLYT